MAAIAAAAAPMASDFKPPELAMLAWAYGSAGGPRPPGLFEAVAAAAGAKVDQLRPQELGNIAWAFARVRIADDALFDAFGGACERRAAALEPQHVAMLSWSCATLGYGSAAGAGGGDAAGPSRLLQVLAARTLALGPEAFTPQGLANVGWAFGRLERPAGAAGGSHWAPLFAAIDAEVSRRLGEGGRSPFSAQELSNLVWAFGHVQGGSAAFWAGAAGAARQHIGAAPAGAMRAREVCGLVWGFARSPHLDPELLDDLAADVSVRIDALVEAASCRAPHGWKSSSLGESEGERPGWNHFQNAVAARARGGDFHPREVSSLANSFEVAAASCSDAAPPALAAVGARCAAIVGRGAQSAALLRLCYPAEGRPPDSPGHLVAGAAHARAAAQAGGSEESQSLPDLCFAIEVLPQRLRPAPAGRSIAPSPSGLLPRRSRGRVPSRRQKLRRHSRLRWRWAPLALLLRWMQPRRRRRRSRPRLRTWPSLLATWMRSLTSSRERAVEAVRTAAGRLGSIWCASWG